MPNPFEAIPIAKSNLQFPGGDISIRDTEKAHILFSELTSCDEEQQLTRLKNLRRSEIDNWRGLPRQDVNFKELLNLHEAWGESVSNMARGAAIAHIGTFSTLAFIKHSNMLPTRYKDFTEELKTMSEYDADTLTLFANEAWSNMHKAHPVIYGALAPLVRHLANMNDISEDDESSLVLLDASSALPYLMTSTTRMIVYMDSALKRDLPFLNDQPPKADTIAE